MKNRAAKLARDLDIELGDSFLRGSSTRRSIGIILRSCERESPRSEGGFRRASLAVG